MRKFTLELEVDERIIGAGTTPAGLLHDLSDEYEIGALQDWNGESGAVRISGVGIILPNDIEDIQDAECSDNWPILYTWKFKGVE